jgi:hypothetical protein
MVSVGRSIDSNLAAWDSNLVKVNPLYLSLNWDAAGMYTLRPFGRRGGQIQS